MRPLAALVGALAIAGAGAPCARARSASQELAALRGAEGPLDNDAFLPVATAAASALDRFDRAHAALRGRADDAGATREWNLALDELENALKASARGDGVAPWALGASASAELCPDVDGTLDPKADRRREGVEFAVRRRLATLPTRARALWAEGVGVRGEERFVRAERELAALAEVERNAPWTQAAFSAAIALADAALERASPAEAHGWLQRASEHGRECNTDLARLAAREALVVREFEEQGSSRGWSLGSSLGWSLGTQQSKSAEEGARHERSLSDASGEGGRAVGRGDAGSPEQNGRNAASADATEGWRTARGLLFRGSVAIDELGQRVQRVALDPGLGVRPGMAFLDGGRAVVHLPSSLTLGSERLDRLVLVDLATAARVAVTTPMRLFEPLGVQPGSTERPVEPPGWPLEPATDGRAVVLTLGRRSYDNDNLLACVEFVEQPGAAAPPELALRWAWHGGVPVAGPLARDAGFEGDALEFQPGVAVRDGAVYALVREFTGGGRGNVEDETQARSAAEIRTWLACFDLGSGALRWRTFVGKGGELQRSAGRFFNADLPTAAAQPLAFEGGHVLVGSHTGFAAALERLDGRLAWSFRYRRRDPTQRAWTGARPAVADGTALLAPADSDHLYWLRAQAARDGGALFASPPRVHGEAEALLGGDERGAVVLARVGAGRAAAEWDARRGSSALAPELGPQESFAGDGAASATRALFASNRGLYLLDRSRELYLLDYAPLVPPLEGLPPSGGSVRASGEWMCVLGAATLWVFSPRP
ncbi:MAG: PQQ-like beta-propeller repeat protein [Planctomycetes bacterium]|nr:PQQ-like beta-propeller repeat protein [Planctomycetota bacterium]